MHTMPLPGHEVKVMDGTEKLDRQHVFALSHKAVNVCYFQTENDGQLHQWVWLILKKIVHSNLNFEKENTKHSVREVPPFAKLVTSLCFTGKERKHI